MRSKKRCSFPGCDRPYMAKGLCNGHYLQKRKGKELTTLREFKPVFTRGFSLKEIVELELESTIEDENGCLISYATPSTPYPQRSFQGKTRPIYLLVAKFYLGDRPDGKVVRHLCGNMKCIRPQCLAYGTFTENQRDRVAHGTSNRGERHGNARLTEDDVRSIREEYERGKVRQSDISNRFGVCESTISNIIARHSWAWLD